MLQTDNCFGVVFVLLQVEDKCTALDDFCYYGFLHTVMKSQAAVEFK